MLFIFIFVFFFIVLFIFIFIIIDDMIDIIIVEFGISCLIKEFFFLI